MSSSRATVIPVALVGVLLVSLAALQYRWIGELSRAEEERMREGLKRSARHFAGDLDREVGDIVWALMPSPETGFGEDRTALQVELWRARARHPGILRDVWSLSPDAAGLRVEQLDEERGAWRVAEAWPEELRTAVDFDRRPRRAELPLVASIPAIAVPRLAASGRRGRPAVVGTLVARLDREVLTEQVLPGLAERHFGDGSFHLAVVDREGQVLFESDPEHPVGDPGQIDARVDLLRPERIAERRPSGERREAARPRGPLGPRPRFDRLPWRPSGPAAWELLARHTTGSLAVAVEQARWRNLAVSGGVLILLGLAAGLLVAATRRAERLARQQMEFVAGVTHELHTPLAAICSAGSNLADGVVAEPERVRSYGDMIRNQGRRLTHTVDQVLDFAGIQSGGRAYRLEPVDVSAVVGAVLEQNALVLQESGLTIEQDLAESLPPVEADPAALRRALENLLANVVRHASGGGWLGLATELSKGGRAVEVRVSDRGPGIPADERRRLFEPFFRGRGAGRGTGLGLSIVRHVVEAHGGRLSVETPSAGGARFVLSLPVSGAGATAS